MDIETFKRRLPLYIAALLVFVIATMIFVFNLPGVLAYKDVPINESFGLSQDIYSPYDRYPLECEGDTDIAEIRSYCMWSPGYTIELELAMHGEHNSFYSCYIYNDAGPDYFTHVLGLDENKMGTIERRNESGEWEKTTDFEYEEYWHPMFFDMHNGIAPDEYPSPIYFLDENSYLVRVPLEYTDPGDYRITLFLKEGLKKDIYSVSTVVTIPERSEARFDIVAPRIWVDAYKLSENGTPEVNCQMSPLVYSRGGTRNLFFDGRSVRFEMRVGDRWKAVSYNGESAVNTYTYARYLPCESADMPGMFAIPSVILRLEELDAEYRITYYFTENNDGSGEKFALQMRLDFSEQ